jgi:hypothetical protein
LKENRQSRRVRHARRLADMNQSVKEHTGRRAAAGPSGNVTTARANAGRFLVLVGGVSEFREQIFVLAGGHQFLLGRVAGALGLLDLG